MNFVKTLGAACLLALCLAPMEASAAPIVDYSALPVVDNNNGFGVVGGVQFLNPTAFQLTSVQILLGGTGPTNFRIFQFDAGVGDTTGTLVGSILNISVQTGVSPWSSFASNSTLIDVSSLNLTLLANTAYGFTFENNTSTVGGGSTGGGLSTSPDIGTIFNGDLAGNFSVFQQFEIPFIASGTSATSAVPEPVTLSIFGAGLAGAIAVRRRKAKKA